MNKENYPTIHCVGMILLDGSGRILIEKRASTKRVDPSKKCIPSGGVEDIDGSLVDAVIREAAEEFGVKVFAQNIEFIATIPYYLDEIMFYVHYYLITSWKDNIASLEAESLQWAPVSPESVDVWPDKLCVSILNKRNEQVENE